MDEDIAGLEEKSISRSRAASAMTRPRTGGSLQSRPLSTSSRKPSSAKRRPGSRPSTSSSVVAWNSVNEEDIAEENSDEMEENNTENNTENEHIDDYDVEQLLKNEDTSSFAGCWSALTSKITQLWSTKNMMVATAEKDVEIKTTIRELSVYLFFILLVVILTFGPNSQTRFYFTKIVKQQFSDAESVSQIPEMWDFFIRKKGLIDRIYEDEWYNSGDNINIRCPDKKREDCKYDEKGRWTCLGPCKRSQEDANILYENKLLGVPRIRMLRIKNDSCNVHPAFKKNILVCYSHYSKSVEDKGKFGQTWRRFTHADAWRYQEPKEIEGVDYWGKFAVYGGGGAVQTLDTRKNTSRAILRELREGLWIDRATRLIIVDFTIYNANINMFCIVKLAFEIPPTGGLSTSTRFRTVKLLRYVNAWDYTMLAVEVVFGCFILYYVVEEALEISHEGWEYFQTVWNVMDVTVIIVSIATSAIGIYVHQFTQIQLKPLLAEPQAFGDFTLLGEWSEYQNIIFAINVFFVWIKVFKYISFNKTMKILSETLTSCALDLLAFGFMFNIVFMAFVQLAYLIFGSFLQDFATIKSSSFTLLRALLGDFDFPAMYKAQPIYGPMFFVFYIFACFFILLNMFLAIINDSYSAVKSEMEEAKCEFEVTDYFARGYNNILGSVAMRNKLIDVENAIKLANEDGTVTYEEIRSQLKKVDFSDVEIDVFFGMNDINGDGTIDNNESNDICYGSSSEDSDDDEEMNSYDSRFGTINKGSNDIVTNNDFEIIERRVNKMEHSISSIVSKIDAVLSKMDVITHQENNTEAETTTEVAINITSMDTDKLEDITTLDI